MSQVSPPARFPSKCGPLLSRYAELKAAEPSNYPQLFPSDAEPNYPALSPKGTFPLNLHPFSFELLSPPLLFKAADRLDTCIQHICPTFLSPFFLLLCIPVYI